MRIEDLNEYIKSFKTIRLNPFGDKSFTQTFVEGIGYVYLNAGEKSITLYNKVEKLESALIEKHRDIFEILLNSNIISGIFGNIRIAYDSDTKVIWLCHDVMYDALNAMVLENSIREFTENAGSLKEQLLTRIIEILQNVSQGTSISSILESMNVDKGIQRQDAAYTASGLNQNSSPSQSSENNAEEIPAIDIMVNQAMFMMA